MPTNKKPRKKHRPRPLADNPIFRFDAASERNLQLIPHQALDSIRQGEGQESDWHVLAARVNLGATLAYRRFDTPEARDLLDSAQDALRSGWERGERTGRWGFSGPEMTTVGQALNLTDEMQLQCTRIEISAALREVYARAAVYR